MGVFIVGVTDQNNNVVNGADVAISIKDIAGIEVYSGNSSVQNASGVYAFDDGIAISILLLGSPGTVTGGATSGAYYNTFTATCDSNGNGIGAVQLALNPLAGIWFRIVQFFTTIYKWILSAFIDVIIILVILSLIFIAFYYVTGTNPISILRNLFQRAKKLKK